VQPSSVGSGPTTVVIRGSSETVVQPSSAGDAAPVVLRGPPSAAVPPPVTEYACASGSDYAPGYGCVTWVWPTSRMITTTDPIMGLTGFPPAAGTRASGTASPMVLAASSRLNLVSSSLVALGTASCKAAGLAAGRESCRVRPPVSEPLRPPRRSAGSGLCRSPRIGAPSLTPCPRGSFRLYTNVFTICQYDNMRITKTPTLFAP
jgi:hypothetical protein